MAGLADSPNSSNGPGVTAGAMHSGLTLAAGDSSLALAASHPRIALATPGLPLTLSHGRHPVPTISRANIVNIHTITSQITGVR
jgi:hypothetical protein